jgi:hypothetical protein
MRHNESIIGHTLNNDMESEIENINLMKNEHLDGWQSSKVMFCEKSNYNENDDDEDDIFTWEFTFSSRWSPSDLKFHPKNEC